MGQRTIPDFFIIGAPKCGTSSLATWLREHPQAQQSGVDHSTISRLIRGDRMPSLGTATKLARGLREIRDDADKMQKLLDILEDLDDVQQVYTTAALVGPIHTET